MRKRHRLGALALAILTLTTAPALAGPVLLISIDGLRPGDVGEADQRGLRLLICGGWPARAPTPAGSQACCRRSPIPATRPC